MENAETQPAPFPFIVRIYESVPSWPAGRHEVEVYGFGAKSKGEAETQAAEYVSWFGHRNGRAHRATVRLFCETCRASGVKPGCTRKPCESCHGVGTREIA
jgi:hypothetical protein